MSAKIDAYTFEEFKARATEFHSYPAPGLLIGGFMVSMAKRHIPEGTLFEALVETAKCLPDAVQLLTLCSTGNQWMRVLNLGRYAVSLYDKYTGEGVRVHLDVAKMGPYPEIRGWFLKEKPKKEQDTDQLMHEIEQAGEDILSLTPVRVNPRYLGHNPMPGIVLCPMCGEAYPKGDGPICRGCQGEAPYVVRKEKNPVGATQHSGATTHSTVAQPAAAPAAAQAPRSVVVPVEEAVGRKALHDMTQIIPGDRKEAAFAAGQTITAGDLCRLQQMGRFNVAVLDESPVPGSLLSGFDEWVHENEAAEALAQRMAGPGVSFSLPPKEGKVSFRAQIDGMLNIDVDRLKAFNMVPDVMLATRQDNMLVEKDSEIAGTRAIPLYIKREWLAQALSVLGTQPLFSVTPLRAAKAAVLITGTEVFQGIIEDRFLPVITAKVEALHGKVVYHTIVPDVRESIIEATRAAEAAGADILITTGGLSVDPDDITRASLIEAGLTDVLHGIPVLPGTMTLTGRIRAMQVLGVPACALYYKTTAFDLIYPRLLAGQPISRAFLARLGHGGLCMNCKRCTFPKCFFGK